VAEAAVIGVPDEIKGSAIVCVCVPLPCAGADQNLCELLAAAVVDGMGHSYRPKCIVLVDDLPKTRNMKIMRRVVRAVYQGQNLGDLSSLVNPGTVKELQRKFATSDLSVSVRRSPS
jgi:acetyl-CoA synthetase